ncbi:MAG: aminotransferase class IV, partial [Balneolaceae bacterium]
MAKHTMHVYLNGSYIPQSEATVSVADRGFVFGDGIYEVTRVVNGRFILENEHLERLKTGLRGLKINFNQDLIDQIPEISRELIKRNDQLEGEAAVYLQITRGSAWPRTHTFPDPEVAPLLYLSSSVFHPHKKLHEAGVDTIKLPDIRWARCNLKTVNLLPNTLAKQQAIEAGVNSAILVRDGVITESPNANIFGVKDGELYTFPESNYILSGITRGAVISIAHHLGIKIHFTPMREEDLFSLDELFFSGTTTDIQPINTVDGKKIG